MSDISGTGSSGDRGKRNKTPYHPSFRTESLENLIREHMVRTEGVESHQFLPNDKLEELISPITVQHELTRLNIKGEISSTAREICGHDKKVSRRKIFAILCLLDKADEIEQFIEEGISDGDLPFDFTSSGDVIHGKSREPVISFRSSNWRRFERDVFDKYQWQFMAPFFAADKDNQYNHAEILPFVESKVNQEDGDIAWGFERAGGFSTVRRVKIHPAHHNYQRTDETEVFFAIKELQVGQKTNQANVEAFEREVEALKRLKSYNHDHLVALLATYKSNDRLNIVFPWANGNLLDFWKRYSIQSLRPAMKLNFTRWMLEQFVGLTHALQIIHSCPVDVSNSPALSLQEREAKYGRHGDIKPQNILWFKSNDLATNPSARDPDHYGTFKISDFGLSEFHSAQTKSNVRASTIRGFTPTYKAPELDLGKHVSPSYDIWSLGCVLLEFVVWYVRGWQGVDEFAAKRVADSEDLIPCDDFYKIEPGAENRLGASIKPSVLEEIRSLKYHPASSDLILDLLEFIENHLLQVKTVDRASAQAVVEALVNFKKHCDEDAAYCTHRIGRAGKLEHKPSSIVELESSEDESSDGSSEYDSTSLYDLCNRVLESIMSALQGTGWAREDTDTTNHLRSASMHMEHWKNSIHWILVTANPSISDSDSGDVVSELLESLEDHEPFLAGIIRSYLESISEALSEMSALWKNGTTQQKSSLLSMALRKDLETSIQCLGQQLIPLRAFAETSISRKKQNDHIPESHVPEIEVPELRLNDSIEEVDFADIEEDMDLGTIEELLLGAQVTGQEPGHVFLPLKALQDVLTEERIETQLVNFYENVNEVMEFHLSEYVKLVRTKYIKVFAILLMLDKGNEIREFINKGVSDQALPFTWKQMDGQMLLASVNDENHLPECFWTWKMHECDLFLAYQRRIMVPYLDFDATTGSVQHIDFADDTILPFLEGGVFPRGAYSDVIKVKIHPDCHGFKGILGKIQTNDVFAIKCLSNTQMGDEAMAFQKEVEMLKPLSRSHSHIASLLMTWNFRGDSYLLFPYAECDLANFWNDPSNSSSWDVRTNTVDLDTVSWMSEQISGLADAIDSLHQPRDASGLKFGRHGDLKPENILWYPDPEHSRGTLVISDFGSSALNTVNSRSNIPADKVAVTPSYRPPEYDVQGGKASRASDIWSFGCVLLEFVCWGLEGGSLVQTFTNERATPYITGHLSDVFFDYSLISDGNYSVAVKKQVSAFIAKLHCNEHCTDYFHDLLDIIENDMLIVLSPNCRRSSSRELADKFRNMHIMVTSSKDYGQRTRPEERPVRQQAPVKVVLNTIILKRAREHPFTIWTPSTETIANDHRSATDQSMATLDLEGIAIEEKSGTTGLSSPDVSQGMGEGCSPSEIPGVIGSARSTMNSIASYASRISHTIQHEQRSRLVRFGHATYHKYPRNIIHLGRPRYMTYGTDWMHKV